MCQLSSGMPHAPDGMEVMRDRMTQLERKNAELRAQLRDRAEELRWLTETVAADLAWARRWQP
jgi:hypothetical protein